MPTLGPTTNVFVQPPAAPTTVTNIPSAPGVTAVTIAGPQGPVGPAGPVGGTLFTQSSPASSWSITTGLGRNPYSVMVTVGSAVVIGDVTFSDANHMVVTFPSPTTGTVAYI